MSGTRLSGLTDLVPDLRSDIRCFSGRIRSVVQCTVVHSIHLLTVQFICRSQITEKMVAAALGSFVVVKPPFNTRILLMN